MVSNNFRFLLVRDGTILFILHHLNYVRGYTSLKMWTRIRKTFGKARNLSTQEMSKQWYSIGRGRLAVQSLKIYGRRLTT